MLDQIKPKHVREYLDRRSAKVSANREVAVLSIIWNWARGEGPDRPGEPLRRHRPEPGIGPHRVRDRREFHEVYGRGDYVLQDTMDLLRVTSHSPSDVLRLKRTDMHAGRSRCAVARPASW
jgi:hypothetical protein